MAAAPQEGLAAAREEARARPSDEELVARVSNGDKHAFDLIYERYFPRVYRFVDRRLSNRADCEETVQEVFINVFGSIGSFRGEAPFAAWVFGLTRRTIAARFKKKRHPTVPLCEDDSEISPSTSSRGAQAEPTPLETYECRERIEQMQALLASRLTPEQCRLFQLHHLEDRPISEIARELDKSEDAVKSNLYRTRKILLAR